MKDNAHVKDDRRMIRGQDRQLEFRVTSPEDFVELSAAASAGVTSLSIKSLRRALSNGAKLYFAATGLTVTLSALAAVGATTLSVSALGGPLSQGATAERIVDITGWALRWKLQTPELDTDYITKTTVSGITITDGDDGLCEVDLDVADTSSLELGTFHHELWRTDSGFTVPLASGEFQLAET